MNRTRSNVPATPDTANVCLVFQDQYPWDVRVDKISTTLAENGWPVHIVSRNRDGLARREALGRSVHVHRLPGISPVLLRSLLNFPAFFSPVWLHAVVSTVRDTESRVILVRDLPLAPTAWLAGKIARRPVLMDMAEDYPAMIQGGWRFRGPKPLDYLIRNPRLLRRLEQHILPRLDGVLVVSPASAERVRHLGVRRERVTLVGNTPAIHPSPDPRIDTEIRDRSQLILMYVGRFEESRGLETVIRALPGVARVQSDVLLVLVGAGTSEPRLRELAGQLGISEHVLWLGWKDHRLLSGLIRASDICLIPHYVTEHTKTTLPNKLFDYMLYRKPVIATNARPLKEILESSSCGLTYPDHSWEALASAILDLRSKETRRRMGEAGHEAVMSTYNWEMDSRRLLEAVAALAKNARASTGRS